MTAILFSWIDYTLFVAMLLMSIIIGIYYGFFNKQSSVKQYLLGGKNMNVWPISLSLVSSCVSGIPLLTFPGEVYAYGVTLSLVTFEVAILMAVTYFVYMPVFYKLQVTSVYEYFELRFDKSMRILTSILYAIYMALYLPFVIFVPALALAQVTGASVEILTPILCGICIFYTTLGGLKAVVWTDALQFIFMMGSIVVIVIVGVNHVGGMENVWKMAYDTGRLNISFSFDINEKDTFWSSAIGFLFIWLTVVSINQGTIQKCMSLSSYNDIKKALVSSGIALTVLLAFIFFTGLTIFAKYFKCDPLASKQISKIEQLVPFFIMDVSKNLPGLPGLFISGIVSAALSTLSAGMNCLAATIYEDFIKPFIKKDFSEQGASYLLKCMVVVIGVICTSLVYVIAQLRDLLPLIVSVMGLAGGPILGIFTVGMMIPMVNSIGALIGGIVSLCAMAWIAVGAKLYRDDNPYAKLPTFIDGCPQTTTFASMINLTFTNVTEPTPSNDDGFFLFKISQNYYSLLGFLIVIILSMVISSFTKKRSKIYPRDCITPFMQFLLPKTDMYFSVEEALKLTNKNNL